jgi:hypothetical protein
MKKSQAESTTAKNLEEKFDRGEDVLDYFNARKARVIRPESKETGVKTEFAYPAKRQRSSAKRCRGGCVSRRKYRLS